MVTVFRKRNKKKISPCQKQQFMECEKELFVEIQWKDRQLAVPLSQLTVVEASSTSRQIVEDWHYWIQQGHEY
ncbi:MAG: hypothetical protein D3917_04965 [Candidatus Electrothrix sp. AX5]|nr:hypothetical protein [Candidatus Electrothrix sp. AX5]